MEAHQQEQLRSQAAFYQELREVQEQQFIKLMAAQRNSTPNDYPTTPTRTLSGQLANAGHVPQLQWQSDGADDDDQQLQQQLHKQHEPNDDAKSTPSRCRHVPHDTDARYGWSAPYRRRSQKVQLSFALSLHCCNVVAEHSALSLLNSADEIIAELCFACMYNKPLAYLPM